MMAALDPGTDPVVTVMAEIREPIHNTVGIVVIQPGTRLMLTDPVLVDRPYSFRLVVV